MNSDPLQHRAALGPLAALIVFTAVVRLGVLVWMGSQLQQDPDAYAQVAANVRTHGVFGLTQQDGRVRPTALRPPLYPLLLAVCVTGGTLWKPGVAVLHWTCGLATVLLVERTVVYQQLLSNQGNVQYPLV